MIAATVGVLTLLTGCAVERPTVDMTGVDPARYNLDYATCQQQIANAGLTLGDGITRCMEDKGYRYFKLY